VGQKTDARSRNTPKQPLCAQKLYSVDRFPTRLAKLPNHLAPSILIAIRVASSPEKRLAHPAQIDAEREAAATASSLSP